MPAQANTAVQPLSFVGVHDHTPDMRMLYISSNVRHVLFFEPSQVIGRPSISFLADETSQEYRSICLPGVNDSVTIFYAYITRNNAPPLYMRSIHFSCDGVGFNACFVCPERSFSPQRQIPFMVEDTSAPIVENRIGLVVDTMEEQQTNQSRRCQEMNTNRRATRARSNSYLAQQLKSESRVPVLRACLVLDHMDEISEERPMGPNILFASSSFEKIVGADTCDIQNTPFLSLIVSQDISKAARFLDRLSRSANIVLETLLFKYCPFSELTEQAEHVEVEIMGAGSENGVILLCQFKTPGKRISKRTCDSDAEYISLGEIISSDGDTTDVPNWIHTL
ncbi:hypothetical protein IWW36_003353 [Coemansia brasiliensis]|uniref:Uncharacterized protein n=1 Tax=Coemansia brasiliensis TaxID=2650707 RepID=A0A9W8LXA6_9FUNG|nr:hypothetical protein IWW36_003353 [Coemansia brasiliensis]